MPRDSVVIELPDGLGRNQAERLRQAVQDMIRCAVAGYTGPLTVHFKDGVAQHRKMDDFRRYGEGATR